MSNNSELYSCDGHLSTADLQKKSPVPAFRYFHQNSFQTSSGTGHFHEELFPPAAVFSLPLKTPCNFPYTAGDFSSGYQVFSRIRGVCLYTLPLCKISKRFSRTTGILLPCGGFPAVKHRLSAQIPAHLRKYRLLAFLCIPFPRRARKKAPHFPCGAKEALLYSIQRKFMKSGTSFSQSASQWPPPT